MDIRISSIPNETREYLKKFLKANFAIQGIGGDEYIDDEEIKNRKIPIKVSGIQKIESIDP